jgi:hypothetical protein
VVDEGDDCTLRIESKGNELGERSEGSIGKGLLSVEVRRSRNLVVQVLVEVRGG